MTHCFLPNSFNFELTIAPVMMELSIEPEASDYDEADYQLLSESRASQPIQILDNSAERSANLLNAARAEKRPFDPLAIASSPSAETLHTLAFSSPGGMTQGRVRTGKLKRPSFQSANLAKLASESAGRRRDAYALSVSPEKTHFKLPETVNHNPLKVTKRAKPRKAKARRDSEGGAQWIPDAEGQNANDVNEPNRRKSSRLAGEEADISRIDWEKKPEAQPTSTPRAKRKAEVPHSEPDRSRKSPRQEDAATLGAGEVESPNERRTRSRNKTDHAPTTPKRASHRTQPAKASAARASRRKEGHPDTHKVPIEDDRPALNADDAQSTVGHEEEAPNDEPSTPIAQRRVRKPRQPSEAKVAKRAKSVVLTRRPEAVNALETVQSIEKDTKGIGHVSEEEVNDTEEEDEIDQEDFDQEDVSQTTGLERIFRFIKLSERNGRCQTRKGKRIRLNYDRACKFMMENKNDLSPEDVVEAYDSLRGVIRDVGDIRDYDDQMAFKEDAFAYLFRSFACLLQVVYNWSRRRNNDPLSSLSALRVLLPLMQDILSFKDAIARWKVQIPQRFKGDRLIRDVEQNLIAPLRNIERQCHDELDSLERVELEEEVKREFWERRKQQETENKQKIEAAKHLEERRKKWQDLHICRMKIEHRIDPAIRKHLRIPPEKISDERDANGIPFEREPIFRERSSAFTYRTAHLDNEGWSDQQLAALVDGLEKYAGMLVAILLELYFTYVNVGDNVFERLFQRYCRSGGPLEDFNVTEITSQAAYLRSVLIDRGRNGGYEVPDWVKKIPILP